MISPEMTIVAGPPGGGKSTAFSPRTHTDNFFNADDRAAQLNGGSYRGIPVLIRQRVNREFEEFVLANIAAGRSFALETTLRSRISFDQARLAHSAGFNVQLAYIALENFDLHLDRVKRRASAGGHSASEYTLRQIYDSSMANLPIALRPEESGIDVVRVFDNTGRPPRLLLQTRDGKITRMDPNLPVWFSHAMRWSHTDQSKIRESLSRGVPYIFGAI